MRTRHMTWGLALMAIGCAASPDTHSSAICVANAASPSAQSSASQVASDRDAGALLLETTCVIGPPCQMWEPSMVALIARPEVFDGRAVRITGFINFEFEGDAIYLSQGDWEHSINRNALWIQLSDQLARRSPQQGRPDKRYALIEGTFRAKNTGHMGQFSGAVEQVTRLQAWDFVRTAPKVPPR